jgi:hypothetical protein
MKRLICAAIASGLLMLVSPAARGYDDQPMSQAECELFVKLNCMPPSVNPPYPDTAALTKRSAEYFCNFINKRHPDPYRQPCTPTDTGIEISTPDHDVQLYELHLICLALLDELRTMILPGPFEIKLNAKYSGTACKRLS